MAKLPARWRPLMFAILTTGFASFMVSGISTLRALGPGPGFFVAWIEGWLCSWPVAAVAMYFISPYVRGLLTQMTHEA